MPLDDLRSILAVSIGNTNTAFARFSEESGADPIARDAASNADPRAAAERIARAAAALPPENSGVLIASVNEPFAARLTDELAWRMEHEFFRFGHDIEVPVAVAAGVPSTVGQDRLLNALAAFDTLKQACIIVDAGTAVTVDFVDGDGTFQGGVIAPGARMQLSALHRGTAALPEVPFAAPDAEPFARSTEQAMLQGVFLGIRGLVQAVVERYSETYGAFPLVIAAGGDAETLFTGDELINRIVPDLTLRGINIARAMLQDAEP